MPVKSGTVEFEVRKSKEKAFKDNFHLMASRDNNLKCKLEREYFDRPYFQTARGERFKSVHIKPHMLSPEAQVFNTKAGLTPSTSGGDSS